MPPVEPPSPAGETRYLISDLCAYLERYLSPEQISECYRAYLFGAEAHEGQQRKSGEPYIYHPLAVARILAEMRMDYQCLIAALLHDVIEDTPVDKAQLAETFSAEVAELVDGVSKLTKLDFKSRAEAQAASLQKMLLAMTRDIRVILIKLADKLHNMRTLEYLERRYGTPLRVLASVLFVAMRGGWLATAIFVPSLALSVVANMDLVACVLAMGLFATFYATVGGFKGVIWCDVVQFFILVGGVVISIVWIVADFHGDVPAIWAIASEQGRTRMLDLDWHFTAEYTFWGVILGGIVTNMSAAGADQVTVQRYLSARSLGTAIRSGLAQSMIVVPVVVPMFLAGTFLVAYYNRHPEMMQSLLALDPTNPTKAMDRVLPHFVVHALPAGLGGLVIAGIMAATMSSLDAGMNSLANVAVMDYYKRFFHRDWKDERHYLWSSRAATVFFGLSATVAALYVDRLGTIIEIIGTIQSLIVGPLVAMFFLGVLTKRANGPGVFAGALIGLAVTGYVANYTHVFWAWYGPIGLAVSAVLGYAISLAFPRRAAT